MANRGNILVADESAFHVLMHRDWANHVESSLTRENPLLECASTLEELSALNTGNPLYGPPPVSLLVKDKHERRWSRDIICRCTGARLPQGSFFQLREGLYVAAPELVFVRMAALHSEIQAIRIGVDLCARYYIDAFNGDIRNRKGFLTAPEKLKAYAAAASPMRGSKKALNALRWILPNSGSPEETKMMLQFCLPLGKGGFALPFKAMNYDVRAGRIQGILTQSRYSIDLADPKSKTGMEFDGEQYHLDASADKRRRNELKVLGWDVFPLDKHVLYDPDATIRLGEQVAKHMGIRLRRSQNWEGKFEKLREGLGLPV